MSPNRPLRSAGEAGSAYIIALLVLVVLSILGLGLAVISQTEMQIGANELAIQRSLYAADAAGLHYSTARVLTTHSSVQVVTMLGVTPISYTLPETRMTIDSSGNAVVSPPDASNGVQYGEHVTVSPLVPLPYQHCNLCGSNTDDQQFFSVNNALVATGQRLSWMVSAGMPSSDAAWANNTSGINGAGKQLYAQVGFQPWYPPTGMEGNDPTQSGKINQSILNQVTQ